MKRHLTWMIAYTLAACDEHGSIGQGQRMEVENRGRACLLGEDSVGLDFTTFVTNQPVTVVVQDFDCLSSSCTRLASASCEAIVIDNSIAITTHASWVDISQTGVACTDDCSSPEARCMTARLPAGGYSVTLDVDATVIEVPSVPPSVPCLGGLF